MNVEDEMEGNDDNDEPLERPHAPFAHIVFSAPPPMPDFAAPRVLPLQASPVLAPRPPIALPSVQSAPVPAPPPPAPVQSAPPPPAPVQSAPPPPAPVQSAPPPPAERAAPALAPPPLAERAAPAPAPAPAPPPLAERAAPAPVQAEPIPMLANAAAPAPMEFHFEGARMMAAPMVEADMFFDIDEEEAPSHIIEGKSFVRVLPDIYFLPLLPSPLLSLFLSFLSHLSLTRT
jgi:hypothetical protein